MKIKSMKVNLTIGIFVSAFILTAASCTKNDSATANPVAARAIKFVLYTEKDFSSENDSITFSLFIKTHTKTLFDSSLPAMRIKDIPTTANKLIIDKKVPNDDGTDLQIGFRYAIQNVGYSWYLDSCKTGTTNKTVNFSFQ
ncbi:hypothetical protein [Parasediminibacterium sp. JCM 36343]|uniref:hypothetical protein n=1 Tax=Parasediminibacterium sp. JCM 36343 TaxID=3374279 RepID=UPI00397CB147